MLEDMPYLSLAASDPNKLIRHDLTNVDRYVPTAHHFSDDKQEAGSVRCKKGKCKSSEDPHVAREPTPNFEESEEESDFENEIDPADMDEESGETSSDTEMGKGDGKKSERETKAGD